MTTVLTTTVRTGGLNAGMMGHKHGTFRQRLSVFTCDCLSAASGVYTEDGDLVVSYYSWAHKSFENNTYLSRRKCGDCQKLLPQECSLLCCYLFSGRKGGWKRSRYQGLDSRGIKTLRKMQIINSCKVSKVSSKSKPR